MVADGDIRKMEHLELLPVPPCKLRLSPFWFDARPLGNWLTNLAFHVIMFLTINNSSLKSMTL